MRAAPTLGKPGRIENRRFVAYFYFTGFDSVQLGVHICFAQPNIEVHVPFGFIRIGWKGQYVYDFWEQVNADADRRKWGYESST